MSIFRYGEREIEYLRGRDSKLAAAIDEIGLIERGINPDLFQALVNSIVGQQISTRAQITIWNRMKDGIGEITPQVMAALPEEELQAFGISFRKASYIQEAARQILDGRLDLNALHSMSDDEVCARLVELPGVGVWTAEMLMIFSMERPDILSYGDLAIHRGLRMLYHHRKIDRALFNKHKRRYSPCASTASLYLWAIAGGAIPGMRDHAPGAKKGLPTCKTPCRT